MPTSVDEALKDEWQQTHPYRVDISCECGESWVAMFVAGDPIHDDALGCERCGGEGEPT